MNTILEEIVNEDDHGRTRIPSTIYISFNDSSFQLKCLMKQKSIGNWMLSAEKSRVTWGTMDRGGHVPVIISNK